MVNLKTEKLAFLVAITGRSTKFQLIHFVNDCGLLLNRSPDTAPRSLPDQKSMVLKKPSRCLKKINEKGKSKGETDFILLLKKLMNHK